MSTRRVSVVAAVLALTLSVAACGDDDDDQNGDDQATAAAASCPDGTSLFTGVCIETELRGGDESWGDSASVCRDLGRRLPTTGELWLFRDQPEVTLAGDAKRSEWAIEVVDEGVHVSVNDAGENSLIRDEEPLPYRCVAAPAA